MNFLEPLCGLESVQHRHGNIDDEYIRIQEAHSVNGLIAILNRGDNFKLPAEQVTNSGHHGLMIICEHHSNFGHRTPWLVHTNKSRTFRTLIVLWVPRFDYCHLRQGRGKDLFFAGRAGSVFF